MDLWSLADFAVSGYLGTREHFVASLAEQPELLARAIKPLLLRREVADVASDLPERVDADVVIDMFEGESSGYGELILSMQGQANRGHALALITKLRQYTAHPSLVSDLTPEDPIAMSAKLARLTEMLGEIFAANNKVLVFSAFRAMSDIISRVVVERMYVPSWVIDGRTPAKSRQQIVDTFSEHDGPATLVLNPATRGHRVEHHSRQPCDPLHARVESGEGEPGDRPFVSSGPRAPGIRLSVDLRRHNRRDHRRCPSKKTWPRR